MFGSLPPPEQEDKTEKGKEKGKRKRKSASWPARIHLSRHLLSVVVRFRRFLVHLYLFLFGPGRAQGESLPEEKEEQPPSPVCPYLGASYSPSQFGYRLRQRSMRS